MVEHSKNGRDAQADAPGARSGPAGRNGRPRDVPAWLARYPWVPLVLPFAVYMLCGSFEPTAEKPFQLGPISIPYSAYPSVYLAKILFTLAAILAVWPAIGSFARA